ncbi:hypothetical protein [Staphylococcus nepalensis]|uniref:hypothetical protein n=1 Tax=Staphylococcus nepalensis TaxID=214473 RepID=UPI0031B9D3D7
MKYLNVRPSFCTLFQVIIIRVGQREIILEKCGFPAPFLSFHEFFWLVSNKYDYPILKWRTI